MSMIGCYRAGQKVRSSSCLLGLLMLSLNPTPLLAAQGAPLERNVTTEQWHQDLDLKVELPPRLHADVFHAVSTSEFQANAARLLSSVQRLDSPEIPVEATRVVASIGDGQTRVNLFAGAPA